MSREPRIKLYGERFSVSPYVFSCFVALREKQIPFELVKLSLGDGEHRSPAYRAKLVTGKVPALEHGDFVLGESLAILEYLDEAFPAPDYPRILPRGLRERARARQILSWVRSDLAALREERPTTTMFYERATKPLSPAGQAAADRLLDVADRLVSEGGVPLFGEWSIADSDLAFMLQRLVANGHDVPAKVRAFAEAEWTRASVREFVEIDRPPYVPY